MMDQTLINIILGAISALGGWVMNVMWTSLRDLQNADKSLADKVSAIVVMLAGKYVPREDFDKFTEAVFRKLDKIYDRLEGKVDK